MAAKKKQKNRNKPKAKRRTKKVKYKKVKATRKPKAKIGRRGLKEMQKKIRQQIKKQISKTQRIKHTISLDTGRVNIQRPEDNLEKIEKPERTKTPSIQKKADRAQTGIDGLDDVIEGGILRKSTTMIAGGSGSGKSIFCMEFLVNGIEKYGENGVYISFEESEEKILRDMESFGWEVEEKIKKKKLAILYYQPEQIEKFLKTGEGTIVDVIEMMNAKRIVIDSITAFLLLHQEELDKRKSLLKLLDLISRWGCTTLLVSEQDENPEMHKSNAVEFEVDNVVLLYNIKKGDIRQRALEVLKMRATHHQTKIFPMSISDIGVTIYPDESVF